MRDLTKEKENIRELQRMLREIHHADSRIPLVNPDGIYGIETTDAVEEFQRLYKLPVTGKCDFATWSSIYDAYQVALKQNAPPKSIAPFPLTRGYIIREDEYSDIVAVVQFMLRLLTNAYDEIHGDEPDGIYNKNTIADIKTFQKQMELPVTGEIDKATWNALADAYNQLSASLSAQ